VSETGKKMRGNVERVLRAMDVMPPFDGDPTGDDGGAQSISNEPAKPRIRPWKRPEERTGSLADAGEMKPSGQVVGPIPTLDLGEKILAEQRRMTARKRKAPGSASSAEKPITRPPVVAMRAERAVEPLAQDVAELQQLVAEIVARDIERLCTGPVRMLA
jgi:hypothetical protein